MKVESPQFTEQDVRGFVTDYFEHERALLIGRLEDVVEQTDKLAARIVETAAPESDSWRPAETLAHMVTSAGYFGWLIYQVASKKGDVGDVLGMLKMRDVVSNDAAQSPPETLAKQLRESIERTIGFVRSVPYEDLRTTFDYVGMPMSAEDVIRIPLCSHLESHIEQIRSALDG